MDKDKLKRLIDQLENGNDRQRRAASYKLGKSNDEDAVPYLINAYNDKDRSVRQNAVTGLNNIASKEALDFLVSKDIPIKDKANFSIIIEILIGFIAGLAAAFTRAEFFPYWSFGLGLHYICMPIAGIVGAFSGVLVHYSLQKVNDGQIPVYVRLILVFIIGFLAGFFLFYWWSF